MQMLRGVKSQAPKGDDAGYFGDGGTSRAGVADCRSNGSGRTLIGAGATDDHVAEAGGSDFQRTGTTDLRTCRVGHCLVKDQRTTRKVDGSTVTSASAASPEHHNLSRLSEGDHLPGPAGNVGKPGHPIDG